MKITAKFNNAKDINLNTYLNAYGIDDVKEFISPKGKYLDNEADYLGMEEGVSLIERLKDEV